jgi:hypothetical protein
VPNFDWFSDVVSQFVESTGLAPQVCQQLDPSPSIGIRRCLEPMQDLPETSHARPTPEQRAKIRA